MSSPQRVFWPIIMIILGIGLVGIGWIVNEPGENSVKTEMRELIDKASGEVLTNQATPTTLVVVVPNGEVSPEAPKIVVEQQAPQALPALPAPSLPAPGPLFVSNPTNNEALSISPTVVQEPVITVTATIDQALRSQLEVKATAAAGERVEPVIIVTATRTENGALFRANVSGHCTQWTESGCAINPTATAAPTYAPPTAVIVAENTPLPPTPTPLPPTPTITPTPEPENNSIKSLVTRQGAINHAGTQVLATKNGVVTAHVTTSDNGEFTINGLDKGSYQLAAYSPNGSHLPACKEITIGGNESIVIAQTMLSNGGGFNTDSSMNIGAAALVAIQLGLTIPEHMVPILDVNQDQQVDQTDADMLIANPKLLACQQW